MQQSLVSVENAAVASDACEQHGIREQKPMIADAGARAAMSRTTASASDLRFIGAAETSGLRSIETAAEMKRFLDDAQIFCIVNFDLIEPAIARVLEILCRHRPLPIFCGRGRLRGGYSGQDRARARNASATK